MAKEKRPKTRDELRSLALPHIRNWPGCGDVNYVSIDLDEDGDWTIAVKVDEPHDPVAVNRAATAVRNELRKQFTLATDT